MRLPKELTRLLVIYIHAGHKTVLFSNTILHASFSATYM